MWRTTATLVRRGDEAFLIDSPVFPDELELLPALLEQARFPVCGLLATHGDWDHLLGRLAFPGTALGVAETTAARLRAHPGEAQRELRDFDERHYLERPAPLALGSRRGAARARLLRARRRASSSCTRPTATPSTAWRSGSAGPGCSSAATTSRRSRSRRPSASIDAYLATLARLEPLVAAAAHVVPGHGGPIDARGARRAARRGPRLPRGAARRRAPELPHGRRDAEQRRLHAANVAGLAGA